MDKFDGIRMQNLIKIEDPDADGGLTLIFENGKIMKIRAAAGNLSSEIS